MMAPSGDDEQGGLEAALLVLDEYMTSEWPEAATHEENEQLSELSDNRATTPPPAPSQTKAPRRRRSKSQGFKEPGLANAYSSKDASGKKPVTWDPNKARNERKGELIYLRKRVADLELKLERLKQPSEHGSPRTPIEDTNNSGSDATALLLSSSELTAECVGRHAHGVSCMWRGVAHRQCQERLKSERENVRLKLVLEKQLKIAKTLDKIVTKKAAIKELERCVNEIFSENEAPSSPMDECETAESAELLLLEEEETSESSETLGEFTSLLLLP
ncbi:hypothetical protein Gpo141_00013075 [Globisporangium polare]